jgi:hypothetical protein
MHTRSAARARELSEAKTPEPPFDFGAFVAERRGIALEQAEAQIATWLASYEPSASRRLGAAPEELRICA